MNIVIFSGGSGSKVLQESIYNLMGDFAKVDVIISAYDNGKSTGACRYIFNGDILGPSDLRKNNLLRYKLKYGYTDLYDLVNCRFDANSKEDAYKFAITEIERIDFHGKDKFIEYVNNFFFSDFTHKIYRDTLSHVSFRDFSLGNILYASCANMHGNSLSEASKEICSILNIEDDVHLISDDNVFLNAITESGEIISDEGELVEWNRMDRITDLVLLDKCGNSFIPEISDTCKELIQNADLIIFSAGTVFSSLIPTYMNKGVREALEKSNAKQYLIMNNVQDKDMPNFNGIDILTEIGKYINLHKLTVIWNTYAMDALKYDDKSDALVMNNVSCIVSNCKNDKMHNNQLVHAILNDYYSFLQGKSLYIFDYDGTVYSAEDASISAKNMQALSGKNAIILSGNDIMHFRNTWIPNNKQCTFFIDGGIDEYRYDGATFKYIKKLTNEYNINHIYFKLLSDILKLKYPGITTWNFSNRGGVVISIKPVDDRDDFIERIQPCIDAINNQYEMNLKAYKNGKTTVDIMLESYTKMSMIDIILRDKNLDRNDVFFVGDSLLDGNDHSIFGNLPAYNVSSIKETNIILNNIYGV